MTALLSRILSWFAGRIDRSIGWYRLPTALGLAVLVGLRDQLRAHNLFDTGRGRLDEPPYDDPDIANRLTARMLNGTYNDLTDPHGSVAHCARVLCPDR